MNEIPDHIIQLAEKEKNKLKESVDSFQDTLWLAYLRGKSDKQNEVKIDTVDRIVTDLENILDERNVREQVTSLLENYVTFRDDLISE